MRSLVIKPTAAQDIREAALWYERQQRALGDRFLDELQISLGDIQENPHRFPCVRTKPLVRRALLAHFRIACFSSTQLT